MARRNDREARERLLVSGARSLSDAELLSLVVREGTDALSAVELAERILAEFGGMLSSLAGADVGRIRQAAGCGTMRAVVVCAAMELGRRASLDRGEGVSVISSKEDVVRLFGSLAELHYEEFWVLYLTSSGRVIDRAKVSQGGVSGTVVDHRLVVKRGLELLSSGLVLVHNHPSGTALPSGEDLEVTRRVVSAAGLFDIKVVDHIIVSRSDNFSFAEAGELG